MLRLPLPATVDEVQAIHGPTGDRIVHQALAYVAMRNLQFVVKNAATPLLDQIGESLPDWIQSGKFEDFAQEYPFGSVLRFAAQFEVATEYKNEQIKTLLESLDPDHAMILGSISVPKSEIVSVSDLLSSRRYTYVEMFCIYPHYGGWMFWRTREYEYYGAGFMPLPDKVLASSVYDLADMKYSEYFR